MSDDSEVDEVDEVDGEEELQDVLVGALRGGVEWVFVPKRVVEKHSATVHMLRGGEDGDTVVVCSCDWAMRFDRSAYLLQVEESFAEHASG